MDTRASRHRLVVAALGAVALLLAITSAVRAGPHAWRTLGTEHRTYSGYTSAEDRHAFLSALRVDTQAFDFFASHLRKGDRFFLQVPVGTDENIDELGAAEAASSFYLLPAVRTTDARDATVVLSYDADPRTLGIRLARSVRDGTRSFAVSWPARR
jgi:hypothetical protein